MQHGWLQQDLPECLLKWQQPMLQEAFMSRKDPSVHAQWQCVVAYVQQVIAAVGGGAMPSSGPAGLPLASARKGKAGWRGRGPLVSREGQEVWVPRGVRPPPPPQPPSAHNAAEGVFFGPSHAQASFAEPPAALHRLLPTLEGSPQVPPAAALPPRGLVAIAIRGRGVLLTTWPLPEALPPPAYDKPWPPC
jgi:hypothetical protein